MQSDIHAAEKKDLTARGRDTRGVPVYCPEVGLPHHECQTEFSRREISKADQLTSGQQGTVSNPSRFITSRNSRENIGFFNAKQGSDDADILFLRAIKECMLRFQSTTIIQSIPSTLNEFHLHWLCSLAERKSESISLIQHIFTKYTIQADPVLHLYYQSKLERITKSQE